MQRFRRLTVAAAVAALTLALGSVFVSAEEQYTGEPPQTVYDEPQQYAETLEPLSVQPMQFFWFEPLSLALPHQLESLAISPGTLSPAFAPDVENYTLSVGFGQIDLDIRIEVPSGTSEPTMNVYIDGAQESWGLDSDGPDAWTAVVGIDEGDYEIVIIVSQGGQTTTYTIEIVRVAAPVLAAQQVQQATGNTHRTMNPAIGSPEFEFLLSVSRARRVINQMRREASNDMTAEQILTAVRAVLHHSVSGDWSTAFDIDPAAPGQAGTISGSINITATPFGSALRFTFVIPELPELEEEEE